MRASVVGAEAVQVRFLDAGTEARARVKAKVQRLGLELLRKVKEVQLTGQALHVRSGRLRRSVNERTVEDGDSVTSSTGTNVVYGRAWELGFERRVGPGARGGVAMRAVGANARASLKRYAPKPFLQPALAEMASRVRAELSKGVA